MTQKQLWLWYVAWSVMSLVEGALVMVAYAYMPRWFFWFTFVSWVVGDFSRAHSYVESKKAVTTG